MKVNRLIRRFHPSSIGNPNLFIAVGIGLTATLTLVLMLTWGTGVAWADDQPDGSTIAAVQTIDGTWGPGTITATTDVTIQSGVVITVAPNTTVLVENGMGITVYGDLRGDGPITFTTASSPAVPGAWQGVIYAPGSEGYLDQATVEYAEHAVTLNTSNPIIISNSTIRYNRHEPAAGQDAFGAGIAIIGGGHVVTNTQVYENVLVATGSGGDVFGGGIDIQGAGSQIVNSLIYNNAITSSLGFAVGGGIAIRGDGNASVIEGSQVTTNTVRAHGVDGVATYGEGGGIGFPQGSDTHAVIRGNLIAGNANRSTVANGGGIGLSLDAEATLIEGNVLYNNLGESPGGDDTTRDNYWAEGGGIDTWGGTNQVTVTNNLILSNTIRCVERCYGNTGPVGGGMMVNGASAGLPTLIINNTVIGNRAEGQTSGGIGGAFGAQTNGVFANNIIVNNSCTASGCGGAFYWWSGLSVSYGDLWNNTPNNYAGSPPGTRPGDIFVDPLFADTNLWGYHLDAASPAQDAGTGVNAPDRDFEADGRPQDEGYDMGWDESGLYYTKHTDAVTTTPGSLIEYTIRLVNTDAYTDTGIVVSDTLDANLEWVSGGVENDGVVVFSTTLPARSSVEFTFTASVAWDVADRTLITNTATVATKDFVGQTNLVTTAVELPVLTVTKESVAGVVVGTPLTYTLHVSNTGSGAATNVVVTDALPPNAHYISGGADSGGIVSWTIPTIGPGGVHDVGFVVTTCQESLTNQSYRVITSTQLVDSPPGSPLVTTLTPPALAASFDYAPTTVIAGDTVYYTSTSATDGGPIAGWSWDFDGDTVAGQTASRTYSIPGTYTATLVVTDACGYTDMTAMTLTVYAQLTTGVIGNGSVDANPAGLYHYGDVVTLTATPDVGWSFDSWSGDLGGSANPEHITMDGNKAVTATFIQDEYTLTVNVAGSGSVIKDPDQPTYTHGQVVTLTASAASHYHFDAWSGDASGSANPMTITMEGDRVVTATFVNDPPTISDISDQVIDEDTATGPITFTISDAETPAGSLGLSRASSNSSLVPISNIVFDGSGVTRTVTITPLADQYGTATITVTVTDGGGLSASDTFILTVNSVNDDPDAVDDTPTVDEDSGANGLAVLSNDSDPESDPLTVSAMGAASNGTVVNGTTVVTYTPDADFHGTDVFTYTLTDGNGGFDTATVTVTVTPAGRTLTVNVAGSGSVIKNPDQDTYSHGQVVTLTASANAGWDFDSWSGDVSGSANPMTITMEGDRVVTATFEVEAPTVSVQFSDTACSAKETQGAAIITVTLSGAASQPITVTYATSDGTAEAGSDYAPASGVLRFEAGQTTQVFTVSLSGDTLIEGDETVNLTLSDPVGANLDTPYEATLTIVDNAVYLPLVVSNHSPLSGSSPPVMAQ